MTEIMYEIPSDEQITKVTITEECIKDKENPQVERLPEGKTRGTLASNRVKKDIESA